MFLPSFQRRKMAERSYRPEAGRKLLGMVEDA
jgi:hypothetical protein